MEITYDATAESVLAVGRGAAHIGEASRWVIANGQPMIYEQTNGEFVFIHGPAGGIEPWQHVTSQADAAARARSFLTPSKQAAT